jgi:glycosyltransferase involved in cell wall biosynthesis
VAHVITRLILGGAQENTLYTAIGQHRDPRFAVTLIVGVDEAGEGDLFAEARAAGLDTVVVPSLVRPIRPMSDVRAIWNLYRLMRRRRFEIVHTHSSKAGIVGRVAARLAGVPIIIHTLHSLVFHEYQAEWKNRLYVRLKRLCAPFTDTLISVNDQTARGALAAGIGRPDQHVTIYSGMELDRFLGIAQALTVQEAKRRAGVPPNAPVVGKIARLFPLKGHEQFLQAAAAIARRRPDVVFLLVGDGPLRDELGAQADRLGIRDRLVFAGRVSPEEVPAFIQAMDVVVHTSLREGLARVLPQAGAVGKPVVTFEMDGAPEVIREGVSGYLVAPLDTDAIADRVIALLADPELGARLGAAGRSFVAEHFGLDTMVKRVNEVYFAALKRRGMEPSAALPTQTTARTS